MGVWEKQMEELAIRIDLNDREAKKALTFYEDELLKILENANDIITQ